MVSVVALDAMGVIYRHGDDVGELLLPYLRDHGCPLADESIEAFYRLASLGQLTSGEFWSKCAIGAHDDDYVTRHELMPGAVGFLEAVSSRGIVTACLSNDVSEWSLALRRRFGLDEFISRWVISGDIGVRKPDQSAYLALVSAVGVPADEILFVDDRPKNVDAAIAAGLQAVLFEGWGEIPI